MKQGEDRLRPFERHGVEFTGKSGDQAIGTCPFTGRSGKFYVNTKTQLWDSKTAGLSGNLSQFLERISERNEKALTPELIADLAADRSLPPEAFADWGLGYDGTQYTIPIRNIKGQVVDLRRYRLGRRVMSTDGCSPGLLGSEHLPHREEPVWLCEGEWDAIALRWLLRSTRQKGTVVAVPGAGLFKQEWVPWFQGRDVVALYDHDEAGEQGELLLTKRIGQVASGVAYVHWPLDVASGFDVRDWVVNGAIKRKIPRRCLTALRGLLRPTPRKAPPSTSAGQLATSGGGDGASHHPGPVASFDQVTEVFNRWLYLPNTWGIEVTLAAALSQRLDGDPVWLFLVAPPGGSKTETLASLADCPETYMTSSLTAHALISGAQMRDGSDPSLVPQLDKRVLLVKDFTAILSMHDTERDEIFGILRDAYDGKCGKFFGNGIRRQYESRFSIIAAVTPRIYELGQQHQSLGERFLKFCLGDNLHHTSEDDIILRAINNMNTETAMREELRDVVTRFMRRKFKRVPATPPNMQRQIIALAKFGARLRGSIVRDRFRPDVMLSRPSAEVGSRLGKQLAKMAVALAMVHERKEVTEHEYTLLKKMVLDTIPQREEDIVRVLWKECPTVDDSRSTKELAAITRYPHATVGRMMNDLNVLEIAMRTGRHNSFRWTLTPYIRECIETAGLYTTDVEVNRPRMRPTVRVVKGRKKA